MVIKLEQGIIANFLANKNSVKFKILDLIKIRPPYYHNFTMSVQLTIGLLEGQRP